MVNLPIQQNVGPNSGNFKILVVVELTLGQGDLAPSPIGQITCLDVPDLIPVLPKKTRPVSREIVESTPTEPPDTYDSQVSGVSVGPFSKIHELTSPVF